jgi:hypothetical protein
MKDLPNIADFPRSKPMNQEFDYNDSIYDRYGRVEGDTLATIDPEPDVLIYAEHSVGVPSKTLVDKLDVAIDLLRLADQDGLLDIAIAQLRSLIASPPVDREKLEAELRPGKVVPLGLSTYDPHFDDWIEEWPFDSFHNVPNCPSAAKPYPNRLKDISEKLDRIITLLESDGHASDCATHNMPAYPNGDCDCSGLIHYRCVRCFVPLDDDTKSDKCPECLAKDAEATVECAYCRRSMPASAGRICAHCLGLAQTK